MVQFIIIHAHRFLVLEISEAQQILPVLLEQMMENCSSKYATITTT